MIEKLVNEEGIAVIDNGAATFVPLMSYMAENEVPSFLAENGIRMIIHVPLVGGQALDDCITGLVQTLNALQAEVVIWLNDFQGVVTKDKPFEELVFISNTRIVLSAWYILHIATRIRLVQI